MVEPGEETISRRGDLARIEASYWETRQGAVLVEAQEEIISNCSDLARVEASCWKAS